MSEMVERVAAAIAGYLTPMIIDKAWDNQLDKDKEHYRAMARAAIEAMREPTIEMWDALNNRDWHGTIDAALGKVVTA